MTPLEFLRLTLPEAGVHFLAVFETGRDQPRHFAYRSLQDMAGGIEDMGENPNLSVYHACASFMHESIEVEVAGKTKFKQRVGQNAERAKAFWCDMDVGEDKADKGKGYATQRIAAKAVFDFSAAVGWFGRSGS